MNSYSNHFKLSALSAAILAASSASVSVQAADDRGNSPIVEEVIVTGIRGSLTDAMDIKRDSSGVVDAISSEDIGKFPDTNLAESLQRITGVSIDRTNNEGNQVTVRGFGPSFNLVLLNNRQMPNSSALETAGVSRSFNFREIASETVSGVEVYKTGKANISSGGVGATINIKTAKPFNYDGFVAQGSIKGVIDTSVANGDDVTPEVSGMVSNIFADGKLGVLLSFSHAERDSHVDRIGTSGGWARGYPGQQNPDTSAIDTNRNPTLATWRVPTVDLERADYHRERENGQLVLQFAPTDTLTATLDYTASRLEEQGQMNRMSFWFDNVENGAADVNGTIINPSRSNDELNFWAWEYGYKTENDSLGLNVEWVVADNLILSFDAHDSTSHANPGALPAERLANLKNPFGAAAPVDIAADFSGNTPTVTYDDSALAGGAYDLANIEADLYQERGYEMKNNIQQIQFGGIWENVDDGALKTIGFGFARTKYDVDTILISESNFALGNGAMDISALDLSFIPGDIGFEYIPQFDALQFIDLAKSQGLGNPTNKSLNGVNEDTDAIYLTLNFETTFNSMNVSANFGLRYEDTSVSSYSIGPAVVGFNWNTPLNMSPIYADTITTERLKGGYDQFLPNMDFSLSITEDLVARASYSKTISRSSISAMFPATNLSTHLSGGPFNASQGNPDLLPYESENIDLSLEWYYAPGSYVSTGYFRKKVDNFIAPIEEGRAINGPNGPLTDPSANPRGNCPEGTDSQPVDACTSQPGDPVIIWKVTSPQNLNDTLVDGLEFNVQHMFGETGFGGVFNYTIVNGEDEYDIYNYENNFALSGLSDSYNIVAFYERHNFQTRLAYNWRDSFFLSGDSEPIFTEEYGQLDVSASYDINDHVSVFFEGINVTDETVRRHGRFSNQLVDYEEYGPRYNVGLRAKF